MTASAFGTDARDLAEIVDGVEALAADLRDARIVVTGATGWFGTWLLDGLVAFNRARSLDLSIVAISRDPRAFAARHPAVAAAPEIEWLAADVRRPLPKIDDVTHVIHAAADTTEAGNAGDPAVMIGTMVDGMKHVLDLAARPCRARVLVTSSGAVYGPQPVVGVREDAPIVRDAANPYATGKQEAEALAREAVARDGARVVVARCFAFVGPRMPLDAHLAIGNFVRDATAGDVIRVRGDGTSLRSYLYASDLVVWLLHALCRGLPGRTYNVGSDEAHSIAAIARRCAALTDARLPVVIESRTKGGRHYVPDTTRACEELGLTLRVSLDVAVTRTLAWAAAQRLPHTVDGRVTGS